MSSWGKLTSSLPFAWSPYTIHIYWQGHYYIDTRLPFGLRSAPFLFNQYAVALLWILQNNYGITDSIDYLDDYPFAAPPDSTSCSTHIGQFLTACHRLGIPVATDKLKDWAPQQLSSTCVHLVAGAICGLGRC